MPPHIRQPIMDKYGIKETISIKDVAVIGAARLCEGVEYGPYIEAKTIDAEINRLNGLGSATYFAFDDIEPPDTGAGI